MSINEKIPFESHVTLTLSLSSSLVEFNFSETKFYFSFKYYFMIKDNGKVIDN
jgi:hypothetical protein